MADRSSTSPRSAPAHPDFSQVADIIEVGNRYYVLATSSLADEGDQVLKHDESFAVFDRYGDVKPVGMAEEGFYHQGTRHLSTLLLRIGTERPLLLGSTAKADNSRLAVDLTNPDMTLDGGAVAHGTLHLARSKVLWEGVCYERIVIRNFALHALRVPLAVHYASDFADIFEVRGLRRERKGTLAPPEVRKAGASIAYDGLDGVRRTTRIAFGPPPAEHDEATAHFVFDLPPGEATTLEIAVAADVDGTRSASIGYGPALESVRERQQAADRDRARIESSSEPFNEWTDRSLADLVMMTSRTEHGPYPYAGVPWFSTVFGRDGIITARQALWAMPELARGVLAFLAATQATEQDPSRDAEPGKILHELRRGEMAATGEHPFARYYGSHDATPLFVWLAAEYYRRTCDLELVRSIWPSVERALAWMDGPGDADGDGFLDYARRTPSGLEQQGWKDSNDSIFHADGALARGPIALCEVQGYAFAARHGAAELAEALGDAERASVLRRKADALRARFEDAFWLEDLGTYAIALDGEKRPCRVRTSNPGHCLATGIVAPDRADRVAETLLSDAMFSGWGVRTLAAGEARYNPMSYHNGSIWPHDNGLVALGLSRYRHQAGATRILAALWEASREFELSRLPELFCGFTRREDEAPTLYPVACSPQSWAAGVSLMLIEATLGMRIDGANRSVRFERGRLPPGLDRLRITNLAVGDARVDLQLERHRHGIGVNVLGGDGSAEIVNVK